MLIEPCKSPEMIAGSDKGFDTDLLPDLNEDEDQRRTGLHGCSQYVPKLQYSPSNSIRPCLVFK